MILYQFPVFSHRSLVHQCILPCLFPSDFTDQLLVDQTMGNCNFCCSPLCLSAADSVCLQNENFSSLQCQEIRCQNSGYAPADHCSLNFFSPLKSRERRHIHSLFPNRIHKNPSLQLFFFLGWLKLIRTIHGRIISTHMN